MDDKKDIKIDIETKRIRNAAVIAHVDHGKTTLVDAIYTQSTGRKNVAERVMDKNAQEKERGITISGKCASFFWEKDGEMYKINISDTPGHKAFRGQVELLSCGIEGVILVVDAQEGIKPGTKEVVFIAQGYGAKPILCVNKVDRVDPDKREYKISEVVNNVLSLLAEGNMDDLNSPVLYGSGRNGTLSADLPNCLNKGDISELFDTIIDYIQPPKIIDGPSKVLVTMMDFNKYIGTLIIGYVVGSRLSAGSSMTTVDSSGNVIEKFKITKLFTMNGTEYEEVSYVNVGDIAVIAGSSKTYVTHTVGVTNNASDVVDALPAPKIQKPSLCVTFYSLPDIIKDERKPSSISDVKEYLINEGKRNPGIIVKDTSAGIEVYGREELQFEVIAEAMRREGLEFMLGKPVILTKEENGKRLEAYDKIDITCPNEYSDAVVSEMNFRRSKMEVMDVLDNSTQFVFSLAAKNAIGLSNKFSTLSSGAIVMNSIFDKWGDPVEDINARTSGVLLASSSGVCTAYALDARKNKGTYFISPGETIFENQIVGQSATDRTENLNVCEAKKLTNVRAAGSDDAVVPPIPKVITVASGLVFIENYEDNNSRHRSFKEYVVVKPTSIFLYRINISSSF